MAGYEADCRTGIRSDPTRCPTQQLWEMRDQEPRAREELVRRYMGLARSIGLRFRNPREPLEDVLQVAYVGLVKAINRYEVERHVPFEAFASPTIRGELLRHVRDDSMPIRIPRSLQAQAQQAERKREELAAEFGRSPTTQEIGSSLGEDPETVRRALATRETKVSLRLAEPNSDHDAQGRTFWPGASDPGYSQVEARALLQAIGDVLSGEERRILNMRFLEDLTQIEIARRLGISQMKVSRSLRGSLHKMQKALRAYH